MTSSPEATPTLPLFANLAQRSGVVAALTLLERIQSDTHTPGTCATWIEETFGVAVEDVGFGALRGPWTPSRVAQFQAVADASRLEVVKTLRGLVARPQNDAFVARALYSGRVRRETNGRDARWVPVLERKETLSELVLVLFVADILSHRETYDTHLSICDVCGRIGFLQQGGRARCFQHR